MHNLCYTCQHQRLKKKETGWNDLVATFICIFDIKPMGDCCLFYQKKELIT